MRSLQLGSARKVVGVPLPLTILYSPGSTRLRFALKIKRFLQFLHHLIDNRAGKCSLDHRQGTDHETRLVEVRISVAVGRTVFIDAAKIILQERAGSGSSLPGIVAVCVRPLQVCLDKFLALHSETVCHPVNFLFAEGWRHLSTAVGTGGAVDPGPHTPGDLKDALVDLRRVSDCTPSSGSCGS